MSALKVLVIGSGLGGLVLAHALRGAGVDVALFERDASPWARPQGYRLHLDADARNAAHEVLSAERWAEVEATSQVTTAFTTILGTDLAVRKQLPTGDEFDERVWPGPGRIRGHANVDRATLRRILLNGLDDVVRYGRELVGYEETGDGVRARFADGTTAHGDVLVGADGIRSVVRRQRAPGLVTADAGVTALYGRIPLADAKVPDEVLADIFAIAADGRKVFLGLGSVRLPGQDGYVVTIVGGRHEHFAAAGGVRGRTAPQLRQLAADTLAAWPTPASDVVRAADPGSFFPVEMSTSVPGLLAPPSRVTLLGDAVHAMTPTLGRGANLAMRDGALLGRALKDVAAGGTELGPALAGYERDMTAHGFAVVTEAARIGEQRMAQNPLP